ncbi:MAG: sugar ABC transporter substrate-binding protein [Propionicimonas sp.]|uniref:sugar ABC transporter substrate-binding protein n=1 Tax=Propionicimonas sp. TaxID=1955623 RepID=UPI002B20EF31|nr:sugar ABC transporter substrate-binding protein [Propionicimonas sp.]MEA4943777.1 sugar ABC transporter substrate-binding protein [Propionicimonas sp.]MEA5117344.1 sugar ABC transporter substrate-binding protein [Propionicimonas sp.]
MAKKFGLTAAAVVLASTFVFSACSAPAEPGTSGSPTTGGAPSGKLRIGAAFPILDQFLQTVADGMQAKADEIGAELVIVAAQEKADTQLSQVENFISQGLDGIMVVPVDTDAAGPMTEAAKNANIPLVYVNRRPADLPDGVPYVGSDSLLSGQLQMEELAKLAGGKGNVVVLQGDPANEAARLRTQGVEEIVAKNPDMAVTKTQAGNWYREEGLAIMENWLQTGDQIDVVAANNDEMALGAIQALKNAGKLDDVLVGGIDATADALAAMEAGELEVTVFQDAKGQGAGGVEAVQKLANGETVEAYIDVPYVLVTPDNIAQFK